MKTQRIKTYSTAHDACDSSSYTVQLLPAARQAFVFDKEEQKWFMATSNGREWEREVSDEEMEDQED